MEESIPQPPPLSVDNRSKSHISWWSLLLLLVANGSLQYTLWFHDQGLVAWRKTAEDLVAVQEQIAQVEKRIGRLKREVVLLEKEPLMLEEVARRELGMAYSDEIIFVLK